MSHAINWFEIPVAQLDRAMAFYANVTGRKLQRMDFGVPGQQEAVFETADQNERTGSLVQSAQSQPAQVGSMVYLNVEDDLDGPWVGAAAADLHRRRSARWRSLRASPSSGWTQSWRWRQVMRCRG